MKKLLLLSTVIISIAFYACKHTPPDQPIFTPPGGGGATGGGGTGGGAGSAAVCFESEILPIFQSNCAKSNCHDAAGQGGYILNSYDNLFRKEGKYNINNIRPGNPSGSELYQVLFETGSDKMPPPGNTDLTPDQKNLIARWIIEGAKNTTGCNTSCDSNQFKYAANIQPILNNYCTGCHSGVNPPSGIDLTTYANVKALTTNGLNSLLYGVTAHLPGYNPMPKGSLTTIPVCEIAQLRKWIQAGALNN
jgi:hypothetical protein